MTGLANGPLPADRALARTGWTVLAVCFVLNMFGRGLGDMYTVFLLPIERELGWNRSQLTSVYSVYLLVNGCIAPSACRGQAHYFTGPFASEVEPGKKALDGVAARRLRSVGLQRVRQAQGCRNNRHRTENQNG